MENINPIGNLMQATMDNVKNMLKVDTVVGDPIYTPDGITLVPISKVSVGFGGGGVEFTGKKIGGDRPYGGGNATGGETSALVGDIAGLDDFELICFLVIKEGVIRMINVTPPANNTIDRLIDLVPQVMDKVDNFIERQKNAT